MDSAAATRSTLAPALPDASPSPPAAGGAIVRPNVEAVLHDHGPMLARIVGSYEGERARREDLLQEISLAIWRALPSWRGEASLRTFVARVAHNRAIDALSRQRRIEEELDDEHPDPGDDPLRHAEAHQRRSNLLEAVRRLPLGQRQVVVLALEGFSLREIGDALALEENTVAQRLSRSRRQLRDWLGETA
ncbi:RNA polymerase sigma factor [Lysobacter niastensis]|uniref:Sigma-70 family RNA polymerase sigma factor n=1 Tax=Lysobacter niastensis TaxID=380629 RepID=A0ABS0BBA2_9GAMM|nr:sigma-70 family RNA polymerase sigma factor [Lysobacter niastensis]MBF6025177.1 sigma-70 family RNA polymerase sigma factor [Lysobacter niastensis]